MFTFLVTTTIFAYYGINAAILIYGMAVAGLLLFYLVFKRYLVMTFWATMEILSRLRHSYKYVGLENIPKDSAVLLLGNHVSWLDWIVVQLPISRRVNFLMDKEIYNWFGFHHVFKCGEVIPVSPKASKDAFKEAHNRLLDGRIVALYPEGEITKNGELGKFYRGYELIKTDYDGVIVPYFIDGMFGSSFSKYKKGKKKSIFAKREITVYFSYPVPKETKADELKDIIQELKDKYEVK